MRADQPISTSVPPHDLRTLLNRVTRSAPRRRTGGFTDSDVRSLTEAICYGPDNTSVDIREIEMLLGGSRQGASQLFEAIVRRLGEAWSADECSFATVTVAMARIQSMFHRCVQAKAPNAAPGRPAKSVLLTLPPAEEHTFGLIVTEHAFASSGWETVVVQPRSMQQFADSLKQRQDNGMDYDVICISWSCGILADAMEKMVRTIERQCGDAGPRLMAGGHSADNSRHLLDRLGVTHVERSSFKAVSIAEKLMGQADKAPPQPHNRQMAEMRV